MQYKQKQQNVNLFVSLVLTLIYPNGCSLKEIAYEVSTITNYSIHRKEKNVFQNIPKYYHVRVKIFSNKNDVKVLKTTISI